ncbi:MAG: hypothetical protein R3F15_19165 [Lysobacterales bacterium]
MSRRLDWIIPMAFVSWCGLNVPAIAAKEIGMPAEFELEGSLELLLDRPPARLAAKLRRSHCGQAVADRSGALEGLSVSQSGWSTTVDHGRTDSARWILLRSQAQPFPALCGAWIEAHPNGGSRVLLHGLPASAQAQIERALLRGTLLCECERLAGSGGSAETAED